MSTPSAAAVPSEPRRTVTPELVLAGLAVLTFALIPIHINTIYSGLPAHPLFLHVPVILIPVAAIGAIVVVARPRWVDPHGLWLGLIAVIALGAVNLTMGAGDALRADLGLGGGGGGGPSDLIARHAHAASILRVLTILFTAVFLVTVAMYRVRNGHSTGVGVVDRVLGAIGAAEPAAVLLRLGTVVLALGCLYFVYHTGDLGAKAVWQGRLGHGGFGGGGGGGVPGLFSPGG